ncbi:hypothetical protein BST40_13935 [Mycobacterium persicum]|nr:hypothetical protein BST40_13935 [Mycobacterium persicum]ORB89093.1 hypothetical protein B1T49_07370 [Mycobacterium persicum]ORB94462.1 hypothetical protein B1T44_07955 [Mycobacterium persicum]ORC01150.1 hypothetical protein B1T48_07330 [Mycobacterium persicum]
MAARPTDVAPPSRHPEFQSRQREDQATMLLASLSPEVKSGRMYTGPGAESMLVAAGSWDMTGGPSRLESRSLRMLPEMVG